MFAWIRDDPEALVVWVESEDDKEALLASDADIFFTTPHYDGHPIVLVRLDVVDVDEARELITDSWRVRAPKSAVRAWNAEHGWARPGVTPPAAGSYLSTMRRWPRPRHPAPPRALGVDLGELPTGALNAITDVPGVRVGHVTCWGDDPVARTGVTAILPDTLEDTFHRPPAAGVAVLNGVGELTGSMSIAELGFTDTPVLLTGTPSVGRAFDAVVDAMFAAVAAVGDDDVVAPVVGECNDSWLDDSRRRNVSVAHCRRRSRPPPAGRWPKGWSGPGPG